MIKQFYNEIRSWAESVFKRLGLLPAGKDIAAQYKGTSPLTKVMVYSAILLLMVCLVLGVSYKAWNTPKVSRSFFLPVPVAGFRVKVDNVQNTIGASGVIEEHSTVLITSLVNATIQKVLVNIGDLVTRDEPLIEADRSSYEPALVAAQQQELAAKALVDKYDAELKAVMDEKKLGLAEDVDVQTAASSLATAKQQDAEAQALIAEAQRNLDFTRLKSPLNGIVITRSVDPGDTLIANASVLTLGDLDTVYFQALVQEDDLTFLNKGAQAEVIFSSLPTQTFHGFVEKIDPTIDPTTRTFDAYVVIPNPGLLLKPGITGFCRINVQHTALAVPQTAVINQFGEKANVFVVDGNSRAVLTPVHLGLLGANNSYEVVSGVKEGDVVVSAGTVYLKNNERVHVNFHDKQP